MNVLNLSAGEFLRAILSWKGLLAIALVLQFLLHLPGRIASYAPELPELVADFRQPILLVSIACFAGAAVQYLVRVKSTRGEERKERIAMEQAEMEETHQVLEHLSTEERAIL